MEKDRRTLERLEKTILGILTQVEQRKISYPAAATRVVGIREEMERLANGPQGKQPRRLRF